MAPVHGATAKDFEDDAQAISAPIDDNATYVVLRVSAALPSLRPFPSPYLRALASTGKT